MYHYRSTPSAQHHSVQRLAGWGGGSEYNSRHAGVRSRVQATQPPLPTRLGPEHLTARQSLWNSPICPLIPFFAQKMIAIDFLLIRCRASGKVLWVQNPLEGVGRNRDRDKDGLG